MEHAGHAKQAAEPVAEVGRTTHGASEHAEHAEHTKHAGHGADFSRRFWVCLALTVPLLAISPMPLELLGLPHICRSPATNGCCSSWPRSSTSTEACPSS